MKQKRHMLTVTLRRASKQRPWGITIAGGADLGTPLVVTRSENEGLKKGDVIKKIDEYDVRDLRHIDAQNLMKNSTCVHLAIERPRETKATPAALPKSPIPVPVTSPEPEQDESLCLTEATTLDETSEERYYLSQPYRTTPLVLPGAKIKKDAPLGECYLRHHPNPMMRAGPPHHHHYSHLHHHQDPQSSELAMKQKVVQNPYNNPIGLYSEQNIEETLKCQASAIPKKPAKFDPNLSETYKLLQEEAEANPHEARQPSRSGVFSPNFSRLQRDNKNYPMRPKSPSAATHYINITDADGERIHQSNSFRRIMYNVLGETEY